MKITLITVGKIKEKYLKDGISEYSKRLSRFCDLEIIEVEDEKAPENISVAQENQIKKKEAEKILKRYKENDVLIVLDIIGESFGSEAFAKKLQDFFNCGNSSLCFVIGGSLGLDDELVKKAKLRVSISKMTFPHQLVRLILLEQVYRVFKINAGETYHK